MYAWTNQILVLHFAHSYRQFRAEPFLVELHFFLGTAQFCVLRQGGALIDYSEKHMRILIQGVGLAWCHKSRQMCMHGQLEF